MKKTILPLFAMMCFQSNAQTVAEDWTATDCGGNSHHLYSYLDSGQVVIMEFAMGCAGCWDAAPHLIDKKNEYAATHPGMVKAFYMDYWTGNTCATEILPMVGMYDFTGIMAHCDPQKTYYFGAGAPMPGVVIAGGPGHDIIYQAVTFVESDTTNIKTAIDNYFAVLSVNQLKQPVSCMHVFPNPSSNNVTVSFELLKTAVVTISLFGNDGKLVEVITQSNFNAGSNQVSIDVSNYAKGTYTLNLLSNGQTETKQMLVE